jgi:hypothetical protein
MMLSTLKRFLQRFAVWFRDKPLVRRLTPPWLRLWFAKRLFPPAPPRLEGAAWMHAHASARSVLVKPVHDTTLLSFITPVWNTPVAYLSELADSILCHADRQPLEWVVLDNGSTDADLVAYLDGELRDLEHVSFYRSPTNLGIVGGTRFCLERAAGRYVLPVDHDDLLYPDAPAIMARAIVDNDYPVLLYSDEDKLIDGVPRLPFFKPDWDPVLFVNQCYTAHLCAIDRLEALKLDAYGDRHCEGSPDWDCFMRFALAGHTPMHVSEVIYSWRMHEQSTALNIDSKSYIRSSHLAVLERFVKSLANPEHYSVEPSPLFGGTPDWWIRRRHVDPQSLVVVSLSHETSGRRQIAIDSGDYPQSLRLDLAGSASVSDLLRLLPADLPGTALVALISADMHILEQEWAWEALGTFEAFGDAAVVGGRCLNKAGRIAEAGEFFGVGLGSGSPDVGRRVDDRGYGAWLWKQHSVSAVSSCFSVFRADFLRELLTGACPADATLFFLGAWAGAHALRTGRRIVYSPFLLGRLGRPWSREVRDRERRDFLVRNADMIPDARFYSKYLGLELATNYQPVSEAEREAHLQRVFYFARRGRRFRRALSRQAEARP